MEGRTEPAAEGGEPLAAKSTEYLTDAQLARISAVAREWRHPTWGAELDPWGLFRILSLTGIHPDVLADPGGRRLRMESVNGVTYLRWNRPKKKGVEAGVTFPLPAAEAPVIEAFVRQVRRAPYTRQHLWRRVRELGRAAGVEGLGPRVLRHTAIEQDARRGSTMAELCARFGITPAVALQYQRGPSLDRDLAFLRRLEARGVHTAGGP